MLEEFDGFKDLSLEQQSFLLKFSRKMNIARQEHLFCNGHSCAGVYCLISGRVKIGIAAESGNERTVDIILPGMVFGEENIVQTHDPIVFAQALTACEVLCIHRDGIHKAIQQWPDIYQIFMGLACSRVNRLLHGMYTCCLRNAYQRVIDFLLQNADPDEKDGQQAIVNLNTSKAVVASCLHLSAETFSRELHKLTDKDIIEVERNLIRVCSVEKLREECIRREMVAH